MATVYANEVAGFAATPKEKSPGNAQGANVSAFRATVDLASQADGDVIRLAFPRETGNFLFGLLNSDTDLGTSTLSIGPESDPAQYRPAAVVVAADLPETFGQTVGMAADYDDREWISATVGVAALPASGTMVITLYFSRV